MRKNFIAFVNPTHCTSSLVAQHPHHHHHIIKKSSYYPSLCIHHVTTSDNSEAFHSSVPIAQLSDSVLSNEDIAIGTFIALSLAFLLSYLQGRTPSSSSIILWRNNQNQEKDFAEGNNNMMEVSNENVFDGESWKEISRPENYAMYKKGKQSFQSDIRESELNAKDSSTFIPQKQSAKDSNIENKIVLISLLILFVPIFSVEFFFALSRQFICGDYVTSVDDSMWIMDAKKAASASSGSSPWAEQLCSPANISE